MWDIRGEPTQPPVRRRSPRHGRPAPARLEELRDRWMAAPDLEAQRRIAREVQVAAMDELPCIPLGRVYRSKAMARDLRDRVMGMPFFWNIRRA